MAMFQLPKTATAPAAQTATPAFRMPMVEGVHVPDPRHLPPEDRKRLESLGWKPGQAIPTNLPQLLAEEVPAEVAELQAAYDAYDPTPAPPTRPVNFASVPVESLTPEHQAEIGQSVMSAIQALQQPQTQAPKAPAPQVQPARVAAAFEAAQQMHAAQQAAPRYEGLNPSLAAALRNTQQVPVIDDRTTAAPALAAAPQTAATGVELKHVKCARCGFPAHQEDLVVLTETDKLQWLQTLGSDHQFTREFNYYGSRGVSITLRTLSAAEHDAIVAQVHRDVGEKRYESADRLEFHERYMSTLMLQQLRVADKEPIAFPRTLAAYANGGDTTDLVRQIYEAVYINGPLQVLATARLVNQALRDMIMLTHKLEAAAYDPDF